MSNYRMIQNTEEIGAYRDGDSTVLEPADVLGKIEFRNGVERDYNGFGAVDYHDNGRTDYRLAEAADYNG